MGSSFFRQGLDPIGAVMSRVAGPNSWYARMQSFDPLMKSGVGKAISPGNYQLGQQYANRRTVNFGPTSGQQPSLAGANAGYVQASANAAQPGQQPYRQAQPWSNGQSPYAS